MGNNNNIVYEHVLNLYPATMPNANITDVSDRNTLKQYVLLQPHSDEYIIVNGSPAEYDRFYGMALVAAESVPVATWLYAYEMPDYDNIVDDNIFAADECPCVQCDCELSENRTQVDSDQLDLFENNGDLPFDVVSISDVTPEEVDVVITQQFEYIKKLEEVLTVLDERGHDGDTSVYEPLLEVYAFLCDVHDGMVQLKSYIK